MADAMLATSAAQGAVVAEDPVFFLWIAGAFVYLSIGAIVAAHRDICRTNHAWLGMLWPLLFLWHAALHPALYLARVCVRAVGEHTGERGRINREVRRIRAERRLLSARRELELERREYERELDRMIEGEVQ